VVAAAFNRETAMWRQRLEGTRLARELPRLSPAWVGVMVAGAATAVAWRLGRRHDAARRRPRVPGFYERALRILARRGFPLDPGETARDFVARVSARAPAWAAPLERLTASYERARFGSVPVTPDEAAELGACLDALARSPLSRSRA
jgi:hypothetical protein